MLTLTALVASALLALPQNGGKSAPPVPVQPAAPAKEKVAPLTIGDAAPALQYDEWIKGDKVTGIEKGKVHVIEFWATWCGPCIAAMPHLSELQKNHPDVIMVSCAASENGKEEAAKIEKVKNFVAGKGDGMAYRVAYIGDRAKMSKPWMQAAGQNGIPCAFIVDKDSKVAWIGHPMQMDAPLDQIVAGKWDMTAAKKKFEDSRAAAELQMAISNAMRTAKTTGNYAPAYEMLKASVAKIPNPALKLELVRILSGPMEQYEEAWKYAAELVASHSDDAAMMNELAWMIADPLGEVKKPNLDIALKAAEASCAASKNENGASIDTLARVVFRKGDIARAIELQKQALDKTSEGAMKQAMQKTLAEYERAVKKA